MLRGLFLLRLQCPSGPATFPSPRLDVGTQGDPPPLELSTFLNDLSFAAASSPLPMPVSSPTFRHFLNAETSVESLPPARIFVCQSSSTSDLVCRVDVNTCHEGLLSVVDKAVSATVVTSDVATAYDPPASPSSVLLSLHVSSELPDPDVRPLELHTDADSQVAVESPEDVVGSLCALFVSTPLTGTALEETSTMGLSLVDSDDELLASRLQGYLNSFQNLV